MKTRLLYIRPLIVLVIIISLVVGFDSMVVVEAQTEAEGDERAATPAARHVVYLPVVNVAARPTPDDRDGDGLPNEWEAKYKLDPDDLRDASIDMDTDKLLNIQEFANNTNPRDYDTDDDLLSDGFEVRGELDPLVKTDIKADLDGDALSNFDEAVYNTHPKRPDTDSDTVNDGTEVQQGSDPRNNADNGKAPPASELIELELSVGDPSSSNSEQYTLAVGPISHQSETFGVVTTKKYKFRRGEAYPISITHNGSCPNQCYPKLPDFDYVATVRATNTSDIILFDDPQRILGSHSESSFFYAEGKRAYLYVIKLEVRDEIKVLEPEGANNYSYITADATMPALRARILPPTIPAAIATSAEWNLHISYTRNRSDHNYYPDRNQYASVPLAEPWDLIPKLGPN